MILRPVRPVSPIGSADDEAAGGVDVELGVLVEELGGNDGLDDVLHDVGAELLVGLVAIVLGVLGGDDDGVDADRLAVGVVLDGDLALAVGAEVRELAVLADFGELAGRACGRARWESASARRLVGGVAEHHALVAGAAGVHAHGDVARTAC